MTTEPTEAHLQEALKQAKELLLKADPRTGKSERGNVATWIEFAIARHIAHQQPAIAPDPLVIEPAEQPVCCGCSRGPEVAEKIVAFVRECAAGRQGMKQARAILAELDASKPDPLHDEALEIVRSAYPEMVPGYQGRRLTIAKAALKRGMELERSK